MIVIVTIQGLCGGGWVCFMLGLVPQSQGNIKQKEAPPSKARNGSAHHQLQTFDAEFKSAQKPKFSFSLGGVGGSTFQLLMLSPNLDKTQIHTSEKARKKGSTLALKPRADVTRSPKQGYQRPHEKDLRPPKIQKKTNQKSKKSNKFPVSFGGRGEERGSDHADFGSWVQICINQTLIPYVRYGGGGCIHNFWCRVQIYLKPRFPISMCLCVYVSVCVGGGWVVFNLYRNWFKLFYEKVCCFKLLFSNTNGPRTLCAN